MQLTRKAEGDGSPIGIAGVLNYRFHHRRRLKRLASGRFPVSSPQGPLWFVLVVVREVNDVESCKKISRQNFITRLDISQFNRQSEDKITKIVPGLEVTASSISSSSFL